MRLNVFYTINDGFVPQLGAAVCSVCENNRAAEEIVFYIGAMEVSEEHRAQLKALAEEMPGSHLHYDGHNALEDGSAEMIIEKVK